jgi:tRNA (guanine-N7-)-methyltransferase
MAQNKMKQFAELDTFQNVVQCVFGKEATHHPMKGQWAKTFFKNEAEIVLELGCGKGEYTVAMGRMNKSGNYLGFDLKGNRIWRGAKTALQEGLENIGFIRGQLDKVTYFFDTNEISEIWITFPDPKPSKKDTRKRFTSPEMNERYRTFLKKGGKIHLKTDSVEMFEFTLETIASKGYNLHASSNNIDIDFPNHPLLDIRTHYEKIWRAEGKPIQYICYSL